MRLFSRISNVGLVLATGALCSLLLATGCGGGGNGAFDLGGSGGGPAGDVTAPGILATDPIDGTTAVSLDKSLSVVFTEPINVTTISTSSVTLTPAGGIAVPTTLTYSNKVAVIKPSVALAPLTRYTARLAATIKDLAGNPLVENYTWSFTTVSVDTTAPTVLSTDPADSVLGVPLNKAVSVTFSEPMNLTTLNGSTVMLTSAGGVGVTAALSVVGNVAILQPASFLASSTVYTVTVTTGAKDLSGNALASNYSWTFTTGSAGEVRIRPQ